MNLTDLRAQLQAHATEIDEHPTDLIQGTRRKIRRTKQRRIATTVGCIAVAGLIAVSLVTPSLTSTTPDPADPPPADYTKDGITFHGKVGDDRLDKAWIGKVGEDPLDFTWTPTTDSVVLRSVCRSTSSTAKTFRVWVNSRMVTDLDCTTGTDEDGSTSQRLSPTDGLWIDAPIGKPARVKVSIIDQATGREGDSSSQLAVGFYNSPLPTGIDGVPTRIPASSAGDQSKDGIRFRAKIGGNTLAAAAIGDRGQGSVQLSFTPTGAPLVLSTFCTANNGEAADPSYEIAIRIGTSVQRRPSCGSETTDVGTGSESSISWPASATPVVATATLVDLKGRPVTVKAARIAFGVYFQGSQRVVSVADGSSVSVDEVIESGGYTYKLADLKTADAATTRQFAIDIPTDKPFVFGAGSTFLGSSKTVVGDVTGVTGMYMSTDATHSGTGDDYGFGFGRSAQAPGQPSDHPGKATFKLQQGRPTKGKFVLAVYLPME